MSVLPLIGYELRSASGFGKPSIDSSKIRGVKFCSSKLSATLIFNHRIQTDQPVFSQSCPVMIRPITMEMPGRQDTKTTNRS